MNSQPTFVILIYFYFSEVPILSKGWKPDNFESHNFLKLSFTNIWSLHSNCVECESFLESNSPAMFAVCESKLNGFIDSDNFRGYLPLIRNCSVIHMHCLAVHVKQELLFAQDLSIKICRFLLMFLTGFTSLIVLLLFPSFLCIVFQGSQALLKKHFLNLNQKCKKQLLMSGVFNLHLPFLITKVLFCQTKLPCHWDKEPFPKNNSTRLFHFK